jgi:hypothetical protein
MDMRKTWLMVLAAMFVLVFVGSCCGPCKKAEQSDQKIKVVVVTGGHDFEHDPFFAVFQGCKDIEYREFQLKDQSEIFEDISNWNYDVIVLYSMTQNISPKRQENFIKLLNDGVGLLALHHTMCSFQQWPKYYEIIGTKYYLQATDGKPASSYKHGVDLKVAIADKKHPITRGISNFEINDETYKDCGFQKDNHVLLTTDHSTSDKTVGWVRKYGKAWVCTIQLGHGPEAYANPNYRELVARGIRWCASRLN